MERDEDIRQQLAQELRPEFVGRVDEVVMFKRLGRVHLESLLQRLLNTLNQRLAGKKLRILLGARLETVLLDNADKGSFGGRALRRSFQSMVIDRVSQFVIEGADQTEGAFRLEIDEEGQYGWEIDTSSEDKILPAANK